VIKEIPILSQTSTAVVFNATDEVLGVFDAHKVFFGGRIGELPGREPILFPKSAVLEPYTQFPGRRLFTCGSFSYSETAIIPPLFSVGRYCSIARGLDIFGARHPVEWVTQSSITYDFFPLDGYNMFVAAHRDLMRNAYLPEIPPQLMLADPVVQHDVWIGQNVQLARGITIGTGSVIAAGSIVTKDVAPYSVVGGVPARLLKSRFDEALVARLLASEWWLYEPSALFRLGFKDPERFLDQFERLVRDGSIARYEPAPLTWRTVVYTLLPCVVIRPVLGGDGQPYLTSGWSVPEESHTFAVGPMSRIEIPLDALTGVRTLEIDFLPNILQPQRLDVRIKSRSADVTVFDGLIDKAQTLSIEVAGVSVNTEAGLVLELRHPDFISPASIGYNADERELSVAVTELRLLS
jgi:virginiamycin A acetyltransferase